MTSRAASRRVAVVVAVVGTLVPVLGACSTGPLTDAAGVSGQPTSVEAGTVVPGTLTAVTAGVDLEVDACALVNMGPARVAELTGIPLEWTEPVGRAELRNHCTFGGPPPVAPRRTTGIDGDPVVDAARAPATVSLAVSTPAGDAGDAVNSQLALLSALYRCSAPRGREAAAAPSADGAPVARGAGPRVPHVDCAASPTGGGSEVHLVMALDGRVWHLMAAQPAVPRTRDAESAILTGLYRLANEVST